MKRFAGERMSVFCRGKKQDIGLSRRMNGFCRGKKKDDGLSIWKNERVLQSEDESYLVEQMEE